MPARAELHAVLKKGETICIEELDIERRGGTIPVCKSYSSLTDLLSDFTELSEFCFKITGNYEIIRPAWLALKDRLETIAVYSRLAQRLINHLEATETGGWR